jgi:hypothetical protein
MQCSTLVARNAVTRTTIDGVEHIIVSSRTLPDNIVMNGGLYPADEIESSYETLERTPAPLEHPHDSNGNFLTAVDPVAINNFYVGAYNANVRRENGRVLLDKVINVQEALKTDRGKRLLDRIDELETSDDPRPVHTSVGVFLDVEELDAPQRNEAGLEYTWVARNMYFDHDALLLESVGAAQPHQGVGMAVNRSGLEMDVQHHELTANELVTIEVTPGDNMSAGEIYSALEDAIRKPPLNGQYIEEYYPEDGKVVFWSGEILFSAPYKITDGIAQIVGIPLPVERDVTYVPRTNQTGDLMKKLIIEALAAAGVTVNAEISDAELKIEYDKLTDNAEKDQVVPGDNAEAIGLAITNAMKPLTDKIDGLEAKINQTGEAELERLAGLIGNNEKYPGIDAAAAKKLGVETLTSMVANCTPAHGIPDLSLVGNNDSWKDLDMPNAKKEG